MPRPIPRRRTQSEVDRPFCESCHTYAAVKVDCWTCHNPKLTETPVRLGAQPSPTTGQSSLATSVTNLIDQLKATIEKGASR